MPPLLPVKMCIVEKNVIVWPFHLCEYYASRFGIYFELVNIGSIIISADGVFVTWTIDSA